MPIYINNPKSSTNIKQAKVDNPNESLTIVTTKNKKIIIVK